MILCASLCEQKVIGTHAHHSTVQNLHFNNLNYDYDGCMVGKKKKGMIHS